MFDIVPTEIFDIILSYLTESERLIVSLVSKSYHACFLDSIYALKIELITLVRYKANEIDEMTISNSNKLIQHSEFITTLSTQLTDILEQKRFQISNLHTNKSDSDKFIKGIIVFFEDYKWRYHNRVFRTRVRMNLLQSLRYHGISEHITRHIVKDCLKYSTRCYQTFNYTISHFIHFSLFVTP